MIATAERASKPYRSVQGSTLITHPDEAIAVIADSYSAARLDVYDSAADFSLRSNIIELPGLNIGYFRFGSPVRVAAPPPSCYVVCFAPTGGLDVTSGARSRIVTGNSGAVVFPGDITYFDHWEPGTELMSVRIEHKTLETKLAQMLGRSPDDPVRFRFELDLNKGACSSLSRVLRLLHAEATELGPLVHGPLTTTVLADLVTTALLTSHPHNYSEHLQQKSVALPSGSVRTARELIDYDPMAIGSVVDLATRVHSSVRALEEGFRRHLHTTPMNYLRHVRLDRAHQQLRSADPAENTVALIAQGWGFRHLGRFAQVYRSRFDELPSVTLAAAKS
ncbi:AraC family transcriptional regulator [Rhodococcus erythropolis]|uniref:AraC family transcriptional regulator n=1 Tax=Rhodococcus erythropolis TaxID=1833 RepID=UPI002948EE31|nr:AraC family transcriptional regulator [Rhodococcus erythropolis]MDV6212707.1 AraC family transcriptional regulator [Rhodococcus erythropolis]